MRSQHRMRSEMPGCGVWHNFLKIFRPGNVVKIDPPWVAEIFIRKVQIRKRNFFEIWSLGKIRNRSSEFDADFDRILDGFCLPTVGVEWANLSR